MLLAGNGVSEFYAILQKADMLNKKLLVWLNCVCVASDMSFFIWSLTESLKCVCVDCGLKTQPSSVRWTIEQVFRSVQNLL